VADEKVKEDNSLSNSKIITFLLISAGIDLFDICLTLLGLAFPPLLLITETIVAGIMVLAALMLWGRHGMWVVIEALITLLTGGFGAIFGLLPFVTFSGVSYVFFNKTGKMLKFNPFAGFGKWFSFKGEEEESLTGAGGSERMMPTIDPGEKLRAANSAVETKIGLTMRAIHDKKSEGRIKTLFGGLVSALQREEAELEQINSDPRTRDGTEGRRLSIIRRQKGILIRLLALSREDFTSQVEQQMGQLIEAERGFQAASTQRQKAIPQSATEPEAPIRAANSVVERKARLTINAIHDNKSEGRIKTLLRQVKSALEAEVQTLEEKTRSVGLGNAGHDLERLGIAAGQLQIVTNLLRQSGEDFLPQAEQQMLAFKEKEEAFGRATQLAAEE
jgi:hypothetical protein